MPAVAAEAANTLEYYPSLRVVRRLHELLGHADEKVREAAEDSFQSIRNECHLGLCDRRRRVAEHIRRWLRPVWKLLAFSADELRPDEDNESPPRREEPRAAVPVPELLALLADPDTSPLVLGKRLRSNGWLRYGGDDRRRLRPVLLAHSDPLVREQAAWAFAAWRDAGGLLDLARDADFCVRKSALYNLGQLPPTPGIADVAWDHLDRGDALGVHATETLAAFVRHANPPLAVRRLVVVAGDHGRREELRADAVRHLARLGAAEPVEQLAGLLREPPAVTWNLHLALLEAREALGLPTPDLGRLREVDNLHVQAAVARAEA